jgi:signal transduction histidine kinase
MTEALQTAGARRDELEVRNRQINAVHTISSLLSSTLDLDERLRDILAVSLQAVDAAAGTIFLYRAEDDKLVFRYLVGPKAAELTGHAMNASDGVAGAVFQSGNPQITNRPRESIAHRGDIGESVGFVTESIITVPLKYEAGRPVGVMQILNKRTGDFGQSDLEVLEIIASIAATAIENAQLHREAQLAAVAHAVGDLSHDIKNKITPISLVANTLRPTIGMALRDLDAASSDGSPELAQRIADATKWLREDYSEQFDIILAQVEEVQTYTKLIADALKGSVSEPQLIPNDLAAVIESQLRELDSVARHRRVELRTRFDVRPTFCFDRFLIERAVFNLVNNAIPETPAGGNVTVTVTAQEEGEFPAGGYILIEVRDTGCGMPPHVLERILRGDAKSTKPGGTGLGTRIVYNAVAAHKGVFDGESTEGAGTAFRLKLPYTT